MLPTAHPEESYAFRNGGVFQNQTNASNQPSAGYNPSDNYSRRPGNWFPSQRTASPQPHYHSTSNIVPDMNANLTSGFYFKRRSERLDWRLLASINVDRIQREVSEVTVAHKMY
ncbi:hypothetical protein BC830DRAFT_1149767 [Chytriomyces sp. MP71]|nr:hypothetical protein BC830DRAFT_1149767 [Chytriomyces sp. MP71]